MKLWGVLMLTLPVMVSAQTAQTGVAGTGITAEQPRGENTAGRLTAHDRKVISATISDVLKLMNNEKKPAETEPVLGRLIHAEPKMGPAKRLYYKNERVLTTLHKKKDELVWIRALLALEIENFTITDFEQNDFDALNLTPDGIVEDTYLSIVQPDGKRLKEITALPCYIYLFRLKSNPAIRLGFMVYPKMMNKQERFPRNFNSVVIYKEK